MFHPPHGKEKKEKLLTQMKHIDRWKPTCTPWERSSWSWSWSWYKWVAVINFRNGTMAVLINNLIKKEILNTK